MKGTYTQLYVHCAWATWDRLPLITTPYQEQIYACILAKCMELGCEVLALGGIEDHLHLLARFPASLDIARLVKEVKGASSHLMTHKLSPDVFFKWQGGYGAFTVGKDRVSELVAYIKDQEKHHAGNQLREEWERWDSE